jgi:hypothetical protein
MTKELKQHWIYVDEWSGAETVFDVEPEGMRTLTIWVDEDRGEEITKTHNITLGYEDGRTRSVPPKGLGWKLDAAASEPGSTTWRRKRKTR